MLEINIYIYILKEIAQNLLVMQNKVMLFYLLILCGKKLEAKCFISRLGI